MLTLDCQRCPDASAAKATLDTSTHHDRDQLLLTRPRHAWPTRRGQNQ